MDDIASLRPERVLDVGCGPGVLMEMISDALPDAMVYGADPSHSMVAIARKRLSEKIINEKVQVIQGNSQSIDYNLKFDVIVTTMSFHHWEEKGKSLRYLKTLLNENGSIIIYETLGSSNAREGGKMRHSLSEAEAEVIEVEGLKKAVTVDKDIISVKLTL